MSNYSCSPIKICFPIITLHLINPIIREIHHRTYERDKSSSMSQFGSTQVVIVIECQVGQFFIMLQINQMQMKFDLD